MRRLSQILALLAILVPASIGLYLWRTTILYEREHGFSPEGKGFLDLLLLGYRITLACALLAAIASSIAWLRAGPARTPLRTFELVAICALTPAAMWLAKSILGTWQLMLRALLPY